MNELIKDQLVKEKGTRRQTGRKKNGQKGVERLMAGKRNYSQMALFRPGPDVAGAFCGELARPSM